MSNVLALSAVTQLLKSLLHDALIEGDASQALGGDFAVTALPPDRILTEDADSQGNRLNLYLHRITPNAALSGDDLPTRDAQGRLTRRPRLALDLHYLLSAYSGEQLNAETLLGFAMQTFHETAIVPRAAIRDALAAGIAGDVSPTPGWLDQAARLADQVERIRITPCALSLDDMSRIWTAMQTSYRTTVAYDVSVVLIEREIATRPALPVLSRGGLRDPDSGRDPGVALRPDLLSGVPTLMALEPLDGQPVMRLGRRIALNGSALDRGAATVRFTRPETGQVLELAAPGPSAPNRIVADLPAGAPRPPGDPLAGSGADPGAWRIGPYAVALELSGNDGRVVATNALAIALAPAITASAAATPGGVTVTVTCSPPIRPGQNVAILVGQQMALVETPATPATTVSAEFAGLPPGAALPVRLRVDGIDSPVIDRLAEPPALETVTIP
ncbi:DUF4255 domain-containing protein [Rhodovulum strictum]|uniref:DUF4255 domain-containing protein n=1 Tax=Rhodovulum strictum TaxID=58314 RepID=A0A844BF88_9RHOB|nr:DUF4255 domain-containing protein [Rhodovulum strictum]MRH20025.1 DUF4255 domain-containing protein [Rhodovulum strictum]